MPMTIANVEMAKAWEEEGVEWTRDADRYDAVGARHWAHFLDAGLISPTDRVLDIGCGTGQSTRDAARVASGGSAHGVDLSTQMLDDARRRSADEGLTNVTFEFADAQVHPFDAGAYNTAISRFGAMFFADAVAAFANIGRALKPGGRLGLMGWASLADNEWLQAYRGALAAGRDLPVPPNGAPGPFALADPDAVSVTLTKAGFTDIAFERVDAPMYFGTDAEDAWTFVSGQGIVRGLTHDLDDATKAEAIAKLKQVLSDHATDDGVLLGASSWIITARLSR
jgi:ubiquinone/menaquinone biosynthesis C-methylase UbiE